MQAFQRANSVNESRTRYTLPHLRQRRSVEPGRGDPGTTRLPSPFDRLTCNRRSTKTSGVQTDWQGSGRDAERKCCGRHHQSLAATIELSLASPMFQELGPDARALLGVFAFFPQGVHENNVDRLFPNISEGLGILDGFCILSLTFRSGGFITMLAPLRDYLSPEDPKSSPLLCAAKDHYLARLSIDLDPNRPDFGEAQWIIQEDVNVEHLLDVFTTIDADSDDVWNACAGFVSHLYWHKRHLTVLGHKIEGLPDNHRWKSKCLFRLSELFGSVGRFEGCRRLIVRALRLNRELKDDHGAGCALQHLSHLYRRMGLPREGIQVAKGALEIFERIGNEAELARALIELAWLLHLDNQLDAAEETVSRAIGLIPEKGDHFQIYRSHRVLGEIHQSRGDLRLIQGGLDGQIPDQPREFL